MNQPFRQEVAAADRIWPDEVGLLYASLGPFRLRTAFQPIYAPVAGMAAPVAVAATAWAFRAGKRVPRSRMSEGLDPLEAAALDEIGAVLALGNAEFLPSGLRLFLPIRPSAPAPFTAAFQALDILERHLGERPIVASVLRARDASPEFLARLRASGADLSVEASGDALRGRLVAGDVASFGGRCMGGAVRSVAQRGEFLRLAADLKGRGVGIHVRDISDAERIGLALEAGADFLQGAWLAPFSLAGSIDEFEPLPLPAPKIQHRNS